MAPRPPLLRRANDRAPRCTGRAQLLALGLCLAALAGAATGCAKRHAVLQTLDVDHYVHDSPDEFVPTTPGPDDVPPPSAPPHGIVPGVAPEYWNVSLDETVRIALENTEVIRDLGGTVLRAPDALVTRYRGHLQYTDPRFGVEGALSDFDAQFRAEATFEKNDRAFNNTFFGGGTNLFTQDRHDYVAELSKVAATGTRFAARSLTTYDANNAPANRFNSAFDTRLETEVRQPLWQGAGVRFNRIAGPNATEGVYNGVLIARVNTEISENDFQLAVRDYVSDVVNAYWDLYYAYRDLESKKAARDAAYRVWQKVEANRRQGRRGAEIDKAQAALEQYYRFQNEVENALTGKLIERTRNRNGAPGGSLRGIAGVHVAERRLRLLMGLPINDCLLMRPLDEPPVQEILFDWDGILLEAMARRPELRQQKLRVRRREMELVASRNFLKPQLDAVGIYRWRGFGKDLLEQHSDATFAATNGTDAIRFKNAAENLVEGGFQEWQLGLEMTVPIGFRKAHAAVQNAEYTLTRERALLHEQERQIVYDVSNAVSEVRRAHQALRTAYNRRAVARQLVETLETLLEADRQVDFDRVLDGQRRLSDANTAYYLALAEYAVALKNVDFERGSLLDEHDLLLGDEVQHAGLWDDEVEAFDPSRTPVPETADDLPPADELSPADDGETLPQEDGFEAPGTFEGGPLPQPMSDSTGSPFYERPDEPANESVDSLDSFRSADTIDTNSELFEDRSTAGLFEELPPAAAPPNRYHIQQTGGRLSASEEREYLARHALAVAPENAGPENAAPLGYDPEYSGVFARDPDEVADAPIRNAGLWDDADPEPSTNPIRTGSFETTDDGLSIHPIGPR